MMSAEIYKLRTHRTPWVLAGLMLVGALAAPAVQIFYTPSDPASYLGAFTSIFQILSVLVAIVFGGWLLGTEYRQGTVKRLVTSEPRRGRALAAKAAVGTVALAAVLALSGVVGWGAAWLVGTQLNSASVAWNGMALLGAGLFALGAGVVAFGLSAVTRSDAFAMVGTVAIVLVLDPLLSLVPYIGKYTFGANLTTVTDRLAEGSQYVVTPGALAVGPALMVTAAWLAAAVGAGAMLFARRDV